MLRTPAPLIGALGVTMPQSPDISSILGDPLSGVTRNERRNLIAASFVVALMSMTHAYPKEFVSLGIKIDTSDLHYFIWGAITVVVYFIAAFVVYGLGDYMRARALQYEYYKAVHVAGENWDEDDQAEIDALHRSIRPIDWIYIYGGSFLSVRAFFEFIFPLCCGIAAIWLSVAALRDT